MVEREKDDDSSGMFCYNIKAYVRLKKRQIHPRVLFLPLLMSHTSETPLTAMKLLLTYTSISEKRFSLCIPSLDFDTVRAMKK